MEKRVVTLMTALFLLIILFLIIESSNVTELTKISAMAIKEGYQAGSAKKSNNPSICNQIKDVAKKESCLLMLEYSYSTIDMNSACKIIKEDCIKDINIENNENSICDYVKDESSKEKCFKANPKSKNPLSSAKVCSDVYQECSLFNDAGIYDNSFKTKNRLCNSIKEKCLVSIGTEVKIVKDDRCSGIENEKLKNICYKSRGIKLLDSVVICSKVKNDCYQELNSKNNYKKMISNKNKDSYQNDTICNNLNDEKSRVYCYKKSTQQIR
jgi:hypothetical protein